MKFQIQHSLRKLLPQLKLGIIRAQVKVIPFSPPLWEEIKRITSEVINRYTLGNLTTLEEIQALREAYRKMGKDPARYRGSAEALLRRVLSGKELYKVNNVVDINNLLSMTTLHSVGSYDCTRIQWPVEMRVGANGEVYQGIGKAAIDLQGLPVFADNAGAFGSPTSDSERAMIRPETSQLMQVIISFSGSTDLDRHMKFGADLLTSFANAQNISSLVVG